MQKRIVYKQLAESVKDPWFARYTYDGWENPAGEIYDLKNGEYLALVNSSSTGYSRRVCKSFKSAMTFVEKKLRMELSLSDVEFVFVVPD